MKTIKNFNEMMKEDFAVSFMYDSSEDSTSYELHQVFNILYSKGFTMSDSNTHGNILFFTMVKNETRVDLLYYSCIDNEQGSKITILCRV